MELPTLNKNIRKIIEEKFSGNESSFSEFTGIGQASINRLFRIDKRIGKYPDASKSNKINYVNIILEKFPDINKDWLVGFIKDDSKWLKLQGKSLDANFEKKDDQWQMVQEEPENFNIVQEEKFKPVPYYNVDFSGGWSSEDVFANVRPDFFINNPEFQRSDFACNLVGKSISSIIPDGAVVGFKVIDDWKTYFPQNELYGIITKNEFRTVKIVRRNKENNTLILVPAPSSEFSERFCTEEEIPEEYVIKFFQVIAYAFYERLVI